MYKFFEHQADVGIIGIGKTLEEAFQEAAKAMFQVMCDVDEVAPKKSVKLKVEAAEQETLLTEWLNGLLARKDIEDMLFSEFEVKITKKGERFSLTAEVKGETMNSEKHHLKVEVKAATYSQLRVWKDGKDYKAQCVVDV